MDHGTRHTFIAALTMAVLTWTIPWGTPSTPLHAADERLVDERPADEIQVDENLVDAARYVAISPTRVHDSRRGDPVLAPNSTIEVSPLTAQIVDGFDRDLDSDLDRDLDRADVTAVVVNVTVLNASGPGYVTLYPSGTTRPTTSTVNYTSPTQTVANLATSRLGNDGLLTVYSLTTVDVVIDVQGVFIRSGETGTGRHEPIEPRRLLDTRLGAALVANRPIVIDTDDAGVPDDATAAVVTIAAVDARGPGYFTAWPSDHRRPTASNLNFSARGSTVSNGAIVSLHDGQFTLVSSADSDAVVDVSGYITGSDATVTTTGLFVATEPHRILDTRGDRVAYAGTTTPYPVLGEGPIPSAGVASVAANITATSMNRPGFVAAFASGRAYRFDVSTVNVGADVSTASNSAVVRVGEAGEGIGLYTSADAHMIIDVSGYYLGAPDPETSVEHLTTPVPVVPPVDDNFGLLYTGDHLPDGYSGHVEWNGRRFIGWHPCRPIRFIVHDRLAAPWALDVLDEAIADMAAATGFTFIDRGRAADLITPEPRDLASFSQPIDAELLIAFSNPRETPKLSGSTKGFGGIGRHAAPQRIEGRTVYHHSGGLVVVDGAELSDRDTLKAVLLHELAHVIGLDHTPDGSGQIMTATVASAPMTSFGNGDLNGLRLLGTVGCHR